MAKILITGGSGMIGTRLTKLLLQKGFDVVHLGRTKTNGGVPQYVWNVENKQIPLEAFSDVDTIVHLAGANVGDKPWTPRRKKEILESRTHSTRLLFDFLKKTPGSVKKFVSASAIGYYGFGNENKVFSESDAPGNDFLAEVVRKWESEVDQISTLGIQVTKIRVGIVLTMEGGALKEMVRPVQYYLGAPLGSGEQKLSWIHLDDVCRVFAKAIEDDSISGTVNAVGPDPVSNRDLTMAIARTLGKPLFLPAIPQALIKVLLGEMADLALKGNSVSNEKLVQSGFTYKFPTFESALQDLLKRS
jgi:uncharacterized protein